MRYWYLLIFMLFASCSPKYTADAAQAKSLRRYISMNSSEGHDTNDPSFELQVPNDLFSSSKYYDKGFIETLSFSNDQKIAVIYMRKQTGGTPEQLYHLNYKEFVTKCKRDLIFNNLNTALDGSRSETRKITSAYLIEGRYFGINKINNGVYVIYLNVKSNYIGAYNYAINSIKY